MAAPRSQDLNQLMQSFFARSGDVIRIMLCNDAAATGIQTAVPITDVSPESAVQLVIKGRTYHQLTVTGTFVATIHFEVTNDGTNWFAVAPFNQGTGAYATSPDMTAAGMYAFEGIFSDARINVTAYTSGSVSVELRSVLR